MILSTPHCPPLPSPNKSMEQFVNFFIDTGKHTNSAVEQGSLLGGDFQLFIEEDRYDSG